jgi:hypothetical protein
MFVTFEKWTKVSLQSHDHLTIHFTNGTLLIRSVDKVRSVATRWDAIGTYVISGQFRHIRLTEDSEATRLFATQMEREGFRVLGMPRKWERYKGKINMLKSDGNVTNPESIQGRIRNRSKHGKRGASFGMRKSVDVSAMRAAIIEAQTKRCEAKGGKCICSEIGY